MAKHSSGSKAPSLVAQERRMGVLTRRGYISLLLRVCVIVLAVYVIFSHVFLITRCRGQEMFPAIEDGDLVLAYRLQQDYQKGDVVVYTADGKTHLGRIVAKKTDTVMMDNSGSLSVNGTTQGGEIMFPTYAKEGVTYPCTVSGDAVFVLGDYRTQATDSRDYGPVSLENVQGKVITIVRRRGV